MCYIDGQKNKYSVLNECNRMLKYNIQCITCLLVPIQYIHFSQILDLCKTTIHIIQIDYGAHPASCPLGTGILSSWHKVAGE
jgi:hypothetical protein